MTLIDALAALQEGAVPTNEQASAFLSRLETIFPAKDDLSKPGSKLIGDTQRFLQAVQGLITQRNKGEEVQEFIWRTKGSAKALAAATGKGGVKLTLGGGQGKEKAEVEGDEVDRTLKEKLNDTGRLIKSDTLQAVTHIQTLVRLALIQPELRHIVADLGYVFAEAVDKTAKQSVDQAQWQMGQAKGATGTFQSVAQRALQQARAEREKETEHNDVKAKKRLPPSLALLREQVKAALDRQNEEKIDVDAIRRELQRGEAVAIVDEVRKQALATAAILANGDQDRLQDLNRQINKGQIPDVVLSSLKPPEAAEDVQTDAQGTAPAIAANGSAVNTENTLTATDLVDAIQMLAVANTKLRLAASKDTVTQLARQAGRDAKTNVQDGFRDEQLKRRLIARTKKFIVDCQKSDDYKASLLWFIERIEALFTTVQTQLTKADSSLKLENALSINAEPLVQLLQNFTGDSPSVRELFQTARQLTVGATSDPSIKSFWQDVDAHIRKCLLDEGFVLTKEAEEGMRELIQRFHVLEQSYKEKISSLLQGMLKVLDAIRHDEYLAEIFNVVKHIFGSLRGNGWKARSLWHDLRHKILPPLFEKFGVIPVPRIKYSHPEFDLVIENVALELSTLLPDTLDFRMQNDVHLDFHKIKSSTHAHRFKIKIKGMSIRVYNVAFAFTSRFGITFHDRGIADLLIKDFGVSIVIDVPTSDKLGPHYFLVKKVKAKLGKLSLKVHKTNHAILHFIADKLANSFLTKRILRHFIAQGITLGLKQLDVQLMAMRLGRDGQNGQIKMEDVRRQMAELRDLLKKYHEQAGTIEIDFTRDDDLGLGGAPMSEKAKAVGRSIEDSHAVRWVKEQVDQTARKEIVRDQWRSNAFDMDGMDTIRKPEGPTTDKTVEKAEQELDKVQQEGHEVDSPAMESRAGKEAVQKTDEHKEQVKHLEARVDAHEVPSQPATEQAAKP